MTNIDAQDWGMAPSLISIDTVIAVKRNEGRGRELFAQITEN